MSIHANSADNCSGISICHLASLFRKALTGFFRSKQITKTAKIYHGDFFYDLVPDTAINSFDNMPRVTSIDTGDLYICVFEESCYRGNYQILKPGEKVILGQCGSAIISLHPIPIDRFRHDGRPPLWCWELSGHMYIWRFSSNYKYV
ncbi:MAG: hypothetical protein ACOY35_02510 [Bacillota bacterium]